MTILGIPVAQVAGLIRAVAPDESGQDAIAERFARATWTVVSEPGDGDAGVVIGALGPLAALEALRRGDDAVTIVAAVRDAGGDTTEDRMASALARWLPRFSSPSVKLALTQAARFGCRLLVPGDEHWVPGLDDLGVHAPHALWLRGAPAAQTALERSIAIVGARAATGYGEHVTVEATGGLVDRGIAIVSGAAYGIDGVAHRAALAGKGTTVAVLAGGLDRFYPAAHETLLAKIIDRGGAAISEVPCGTAPTKWRFLQRNRMIAAVSAATVVVEAGWRSGSLNTAGHAASLGRPLGAVPGPVTSAASAGCHRLLREYGAECVTNADEMAQLVPPGAVDDEVQLWPGDGERRDPAGVRIRVLDALSQRSPRTPERIAALSGLAVDRVRAQLGILELDGDVRERPTGWLRARP